MTKVFIHWKLNTLASAKKNFHGKPCPSDKLAIKLLLLFIWNIGAWNIDIKIYEISFYVDMRRSY